jgi:cytochrome c biogenesis protein CcmG, thiol:disulfide interchange protein DsbE
LRHGFRQYCCRQGARGGQTRPDFRVKTFDGKKLSLAEFKGQVLVVNFWATWCTPCRTELPMLDFYYKAQEKSGLRILAVTTEDSASPSQLKKVAALLTLPIAWHFKGDYGAHKAVPTNYIIDHSRTLRYAMAGALDIDDMNEILVPLRREAAPAPSPHALLGVTIMHAAEQHLP